MHQVTTPSGEIVLRKDQVRLSVYKVQIIALAIDVINWGNQYSNRDNNAKSFAWT
jgi:hypothetical protein